MSDRAFAIFLYLSGRLFFAGPSISFFWIPVFTKQTLTFFIIYAKVTTVYMSNAMTRRSTYTTSSQREDGGGNLQPGYMEVAFEQ